MLSSAEIYNYRVLETDDEGDPLDHGVVSGRDFSDCKNAIHDRLQFLGLEGMDVTVRFYPIEMPKSDFVGAVWGAPEGHDSEDVIYNLPDADE